MERPEQKQSQITLSSSRGWRDSPDSTAPGTTGDAENGLIAVGLPPTETGNIFLAGQIPYVRIVVQNYDDKTQVVPWTLEAEDFFGKRRFTQSGSFTVASGGGIEERQVPLPLSLGSGHIYVSLSAVVGGEEKVVKSQLVCLILKGSTGTAGSASA